MDVKEAYDIIRDNLDFETGRFFSGGEELSLGVGQVYQGIRFAFFNDSDLLFDTREGQVYVLTHECDVDQNNARPFNSELLVCPIMDLAAFVQEYEYKLGADKLRQFLVDVARRRVSRVIYLPPYNANLHWGGLLYLNQITHTHISAFKQDTANLTCAVTAYGLQIIDQFLENHLLRPKAERLALAW